MWHFRDFGTRQVINFFAYWALIGRNFFASNINIRFLQTRDNQFQEFVWPTRDLKAVFFRADGRFFSENFQTF